MGNTTMESRRPWLVDAEAREFLEGARTTATPVAPGPMGSEILSWGWNTDFALGNGTDVDRHTPGPVLLPEATMITQVSTGGNHNLALTSAGLVLAWGSNRRGTLGDGTRTPRDRAVQVLLPSEVRATAVSAGGRHCLALSSDGQVYAWGDNGLGQLGLGDYDDRLTPVRVPIPWSELGLPPDATVTAIGAGGLHSVVLTSTGHLLSWGSNYYYQLGNGDDSRDQSPTPVLVKVPDAVRVTAIAAGSVHTLALTSDAQALAWGDNWYGALGNPSVGDHSSVPVPVQLPTEVSVTALAGGSNYSLALTADGAVLAWGRNDVGQLGNGTANGDAHPVPAPVKLPAGVTIVGMDAGTQQCAALTSTGRVLGWGYNYYGQLGNGSTTAEDEGCTLPVWTTLPPGVKVHAVASGLDHSLALAAPGPKLAWGFNASGQLGNGSTRQQLDPDDVHVEEDVVFTDLAAGYDHSLAVTEVGRVVAWGKNTDGQLGIGPDEGNRDEPVRVILPGDVTAVAVSAGAAHSLALSTTGDVYAWGRNNVGQLGLGPDAGGNQPTPRRLPLDWLPEGAMIVAIAAYNLHSLALLDNGQVWGWGDNYYGQLGIGEGQTGRYDTPTRMQLPEAVTATAVAAGGTHSLIVTGEGTVLCCGYNRSGQLGTGDNADRHVPDQPVLLSDGVSVLSGVSAVAAGIYHSLAIADDGTPWAWGENYNGELGNGTNTPSNTAVSPDVSPLYLPTRRTIAAIAGGGTHTLAVTATGEILAWGNNNHGQLGDGNTQSSNKPVRADQPIGTAATAVAGGQYHSLAR